MRSTIITTLALGSSVSASVLKHHDLPRDGGACQLTLTAYGPGSASGIIGQLGDGQNRIGGRHSTTTFYYKNGRVIDSSNRGCILTPRTEQWQCDQGVPPHSGFSIECDGTFLHNGSPVFHACPVNDHGEWNVYTTPVTGQKKCVTIKLTANGCEVPCPTAPTPAANKTRTHEPSDTLVVNYKWNCEGNEKCYKEPAPSPTMVICNGESHCHTTTVPSLAPSPTGQKHQTACTHKNDNNCTPTPTICHDKEDVKCKPTATPTRLPSPCDDKGHGKGKGKDECGHYTSCPVDLNGAYEFPHLIVPIQKDHGDVAVGNSLNGTIDSNTCTTYNFDVHPDHGGKTCSLIFLLPHHKDLDTSAYSFKGEGYLEFSKLSKPVTEKTTFNNKGVHEYLSAQAIEEGTSMLAWSGACEAGKKVGYEVCGEGVELEYFQDWNPSPIGLYMRTC